MKKTLSVGSKTSEIRVRKGNDSDADGNDEEIVKTRLLTNERSLEDLHEQVNSLKEALQSLMQKVNSLPHECLLFDHRTSHHPCYRRSS
jgi:predicted RNase H-like nuclease (RuvC/YqgF family)